MSIKNNAAKDARRKADLARKKASVDKARRAKEEREMKLEQEELERRSKEMNELSIWKAIPSDSPITGSGFVWPPRNGGFVSRTGQRLQPEPGWNRTDGLLVGPWNKPASWVWWYDEDLVLRGFLVWKPLEGQGSFDMSVDPEFQGRGLGKLLVHYARTEFGASLSAQTYTEAGAATVNSYLKDLFNDVDFYQEYPN